MWSNLVNDRTRDTAKTGGEGAHGNTGGSIRTWTIAYSPIKWDRVGKVPSNLSILWTKYIVRVSFSRLCCHSQRTCCLPDSSEVLSDFFFSVQWIVYVLLLPELHYHCLFYFSTLKNNLEVLKGHLNITVDFISLLNCSSWWKAHLVDRG